MKNNYKNLIIPGLILILATLLRFYNLKKSFLFGIDEEYQANLAYSIYTNFHIIWSGVGSTIGFYLGPFFTYLTYLLFLINTDPIITGYFAAFLGVVTTATIFFVVAKVFGRKPAIYASLLYASLPLMVYYDQRYWNVSPVPIFTILIFFSTQEIRKNKNLIILISIIFGLVFHTHLSLVPMFAVPFYLIIKIRRKIKQKYFFISIILFFIIISPLIVFDYYQNWHNIKLPLRLLQQSEEKTNAIDTPSHAKAFYETAGRLWYLTPNQNSADEVNWGCTSTGNITKDANDERRGYFKIVDQITTRDESVTAFSMLTIICFLGFLLMRSTWRDEKRKILASFVIIQVFSFMAFPGGGYEYFLTGFFPLFIIIFAILANDLSGKTKYLLNLFLTIIVSLSFFTIITTTDEFGIEAKRGLIDQVALVVDDYDYELVERGMCHVGSGWRFLFSRYYKTPVRATSDQFFSWIYPNELKDIDADYKVVMVETRTIGYLNENFEGFEYKFEDGGYSAYVYEIGKQ